MNHNKLLPLLDKTGTEACESLQDVKDLMVKVESCFKTFVKSHDNYLEALEEETKEEDAESVLEKQFAYLNEVETNFMAVRKLYNKFIEVTDEAISINAAASDQKKKALESLPSLKLAVVEAIDQYVVAKMEADNIKQQIEGKSVDQLIASMETLQLGAEAESIKASLGDAYKKIVVAMTPYKNAVSLAKLDWDQATVDFAVQCGPELNQEVNACKNILNKVISAKERIPPAAPALLTHSGGAGLSSACPVKLAKVDNIEFSGEYRDFASFKRNFETIVVPNRDAADIGLRLRQALPSKHLHLVDNFEPKQYLEMMQVLKSKFGNPRHIVSSCLKDIDKLKTPQSDESFVSFVEDLEKIERDLKAVNLQDRLYHETVLTKLEHLLPEKVKSDWSEYASDNDFITDEAVIEDVFKGFLQFLTKYKKRVDFQISQNEALPSTVRSKFCLVTGKTLKVNSQEVINKVEPKSSGMNPCLACSRDGATNLEVTKHPMATCVVWNSLSFIEKRNLVECIKHPFTKTHKTDDCKNDIRQCKHCNKSDHHFLLCTKKITMSNKASCKSTWSNCEVLLKTLFVKVENSSQTLGVM